MNPKQRSTLEKPTMELPRYLIIGARPVKLVRTPNGDMDCLALDWETGELVRNLDYLARAVMGNAPDTNIVSEEVFDRSMLALTRNKRQRWQRRWGRRRPVPARSSPGGAGAD